MILHCRKYLENISISLQLFIGVSLLTVLKYVKRSGKQLTGDVDVGEDGSKWPLVRDARARYYGWNLDASDKAEERSFPGSCLH